MSGLSVSFIVTVWRRRMVPDVEIGRILYGFYCFELELYWSEIQPCCDGDVYSPSLKFTH